LRLLQDNEYKLIGNPRSHKTNIRITAAMNGNPKRFVKEGKFREDQYYRVNVAPLYIPPPRKRREDIPIPIGRRW
jgi:transcriptional regulator with PAS, ATPase and Fis domain